MRAHTNSLKILEKEADKLQVGGEEEEGMNKEAYQKIRAEIKRRREAKERLL